MSNAELVDQVKFTVRSSVTVRQAWEELCETQAAGVRDPKKHSSDFLLSFLSIYGIGPPPVKTTSPTRSIIPLADASEARKAWARATALGLAAKSKPSSGGRRSKRPAGETLQCFYRSSLRAIQHIAANGSIQINMSAWTALRKTLSSILACGEKQGATENDVQTAVQALNSGQWPPHELGFLVLTSLAELVGESVFLVLARGLREYKPDGTKTWTDRMPGCAIVFVGYWHKAENGAGDMDNARQLKRPLHFDWSRCPDRPSEEQRNRFRLAQQRIIKEGGLSLACNGMMYQKRRGSDLEEKEDIITDCSEEVDSTDSSDSNEAVGISKGYVV
eukprot:gnl/MRDRNA2_/MRDRNA2_66576_c0_seq1.p1 gnl/MRDRNA2_/MRDRNA2_66576_c0~~gnl/MRDRNA2_/MRDRNA2_66576_c0_seq1.p1  ORF type:complete len:333 (+),score=66.58 gnl/MRDRNA2_/MRDRNA2_66576_c0_seq1:143-1141(+)